MGGGGGGGGVDRMLKSKSSSSTTKIDQESKVNYTHWSLILQSFLVFVFSPQINNLRNSHRIHVDGTDIPDPVTQFEQLRERYGIHARLLVNLSKAGFETPTPVQMQAIPIMLEVCTALGPTVLL